MWSCRGSEQVGLIIPTVDGVVQFLDFRHAGPRGLAAAETTRPSLAPAAGSWRPAYVIGVRGAPGPLVNRGGLGWGHGSPLRPRRRPQGGRRDPQARPRAGRTGLRADDQIWVRRPPDRSRARHRRQEKVRQEIDVILSGVPDLSPDQRQTLEQLKAAAGEGAPF